jgi:hypothetical protein
MTLSYWLNFTLKFTVCTFIWTCGGLTWNMCLCVHMYAVCVPHMELDQVISCPHERKDYRPHGPVQGTLFPSRTVTCIKTCWASIHCSSPFHSDQFLIFLFVTTYNFAKIKLFQPKRIKIVQSVQWLVMGRSRDFSLCWIVQKDSGYHLSPCIISTSCSFPKGMVAGA